MTDQINDGGPAFAACNEANVNDTMGMSLRDYFAGQVLGQCIKDTPFVNSDSHFGNATYGSPGWDQAVKDRREGAARKAYEYADAMIAQKEKRNDH